LDASFQQLRAFVVGRVQLERVRIAQLGTHWGHGFEAWPEQLIRPEPLLLLDLSDTLGLSCIHAG